MMPREAEHTTGDRTSMWSGPQGFSTIYTRLCAGQAGAVQRWTLQRTWKRVNMSRIFDALLRSEAERSGTDVSTLSSATEVLERAERHASSEGLLLVKDERAERSEAGLEPSPTAGHF